MKKLALIIIAQLLLLPSFAQPNLPPAVADSLWNLWMDETATDTGRLHAMKDYSWKGYVFTKPDSAIYYAQMQREFAQKVGEESFVASAHNTIGNAHYIKDEFNLAIEHYTTALGIQERISDSIGLPSSLNNIGIIYHIQEDYDEALSYYGKAFEIQKVKGNKRGMLSALNNMGVIKNYQEELDTAEVLLLQALEIAEESNNPRALANTLGNLGLVNYNKENYNKGLEYYQRCLDILEQGSNKHMMANTLNNIGDIYLAQGKDQLAFEYSDRAYKIAVELNSDVLTEAAAKSLYRYYKKIGESKKAMEMYEIHVMHRDSVESEKNKKAIIRQEYKYEYDKQAAADSIRNEEAQKVKDAEIKRQNAELAAKSREQVILYGGLGVVLLFAGFIFNRFRVTNQQKRVIEQQKKEVEAQKEIADQQREKAEYQRALVQEKNTEILDSINYAKRIQTAILPPDKEVQAHLKDSFVLYKPKDIVAGDFYWLEPLDESILFAAADCTGHGVPGAMVSVLCNNGLNRSVREYGLTEPGQILDKTRDILIQEFEKSEEDVKDGMDIALVSLEREQEGDGSQVSSSHSRLKYAGANNALWVIRKGAEEVEEIRANKQPIGKFDNPKPYQTHEVELNAGDAIYIFSDGYADQFGGEKGKKFKAANFKKLLLSIQGESMPRQKELLLEAFEKWRGTLEQLDDVCVIGVRV